MKSWLVHSHSELLFIGVVYLHGECHLVDDVLEYIKRSREKTPRWFCEACRLCIQNPNDLLLSHPGNAK